MWQNERDTNSDGGWLQNWGRSTIKEILLNIYLPALYGNNQNTNHRVTDKIIWKIFSGFYRSKYA